MSGHNKWSKIKHKKAVTDARKSKVFGKLTKLIASESKEAGGDVNSPGLRLAIERAKKENMPLSNIERAVAKGKAGEGESMESVVYETYGPSGVAIIIEGLTDNNNRTSAEIKHLLLQYDTSLAAQGSAMWAFAKENNELVPSTKVSLSDEDIEKLEKLVDALEEHDDVQNVYTNAE